MPECPVCSEHVNADDRAFAHHVNSHFDMVATDPPADQGPTASAVDETVVGSDLACFMCQSDLSSLSEAARNIHVGECLDRGFAEANGHHDDLAGTSGTSDDDDENKDEDEDFYYGPGPSGSGSGSGTPYKQWDRPAYAGRAARPGAKSRGDKWWDPEHGGVTLDTVPSNFSPGIIPVLRDMLTQSVSQGSTRSAVLARAGVVHIKGVWGFDNGWGCGHRNALMAISALVTTHTGPAFGPVFMQGGMEPGVRAVQGWIEDAWSRGFDTVGRDQLKGKVVGTIKWIGTSDLYAMFTAKGISCQLYDFPKPSKRQVHSSSSEPTHWILQRWVRRYFAEDTRDDEPASSSAKSDSESAYDALMRSGHEGNGRGEAVRMSSRLPLILQHSGHSRTIIGYEENARGDIHLLMYDPARSVPKDIRAAGIDRIRRVRAGQLDTPPRLRESVAPLDEAATVREGPDAAEPDDEDEVDAGGWVRRKVRLVVGGSGGDGSRAGREGLPQSTGLGVFRVNLSRLSAHTEYQVLAFEPDRVLSAEERALRQVVSSIVVEA